MGASFRSRVVLTVIPARGGAHLRSVAKGGACPLLPWTGRVGCPLSANKKGHTLYGLLRLGTGGYLFSQLVSKRVLSAYKGLTSVFGMGTGGSP